MSDRESGFDPDRPDLTGAESPGLFRRLLAILYDAVLIVAIWVMAFAIVYLPLARGFEIQVSGDHPLIRAYLLALAVGFHLWFWTHGGQTTGMRAWRFKVLRDDGLPLTWRDAIRRYLAAVLSLVPLGLGLLPSLFDPRRRALHDRWSRTRLIMLRKPG